MIDGDVVSTGLASLDYILAGGYAANRCHLLEGEPGSGKTTLALQFLIAGRDRGEKCLFITISESPVDIVGGAASHGLNLDGIELFECITPELLLNPDEQQSVVHTSDIELGETVHLIMSAVYKVEPTLVVLDSLSEVALLAQSAMRYRRQVLTLKHFFQKLNCTVLLLDDLTDVDTRLTLHSIAHGVLRLEQVAMDYGGERRRVRVFKMRGRAFQGGYHDFVIRTGGLRIFPRLIALEDTNPTFSLPVSSGIAELDSLVGGGLDAGTTTLIMGASGTGKSTLALQFISAALDRGEPALVVSFEETQRNFERRAAGINLDERANIESGVLSFVHVDPAETSAGEISDMVRRHVAKGCRSVILDSLTGYQHALRDENCLLLHMHELLTYLNLQGVTTTVVLCQAGAVGALEPPLDMTYLADTVLLLRYFEVAGEMRRVLSVVKKRTGSHERTLREIFFDKSGVQIGPPLAGWKNIVSGRPVYAGSEPLLSERVG